MIFKNLWNLVMFGLSLDDPNPGSTGSDKDPPKTDPKPKDPDPPKVDPPVDNKIPYDRFKKVNDDNKLLKDQLSKIENEKTESEKKRLVDEGKWQEAAELSEKKAKEAEEKAEKADKLRIEKTQEYEISMEAKSQGVTDVKDAIKLIDSKDIVLNEDGTFSGITEAIEKLKLEKAYLFGDVNGIVGVHKDKPKGSTLTTRDELLADPIAATKLKQDHPAEYERIMNS